MTHQKRLIAGFAIGLLFVAGAIGITVFFVKNKPVGERSETAEASAAVRVVEVLPSVGPTYIYGSGTVEASSLVSLTPEAVGRVVYVAKELVAGAAVKKGQTLLRVDDRDYRLAVEVEESRVQSAELELTVELSRQKIAREEWDLLGDKRPEEQAALALRKPQLANAQMQVKSAKSGLKKAELNLSRTSLRAPFSAVVVSESVEVGQRVGNGAAVANLAGTDQFWVTVSLPLNRLPALAIDGEDVGAKALVVTPMADGDVEYPAQTLRLRESLDPKTRTAQLIVGVKNPLGPEHRLPLLINTYVKVRIEGKPMPDALEIPREALRDGDTLWVVNASEKLERRKVQVIWREPERLLIKGAIEKGERIVTSPLALPMQGMSVQVVAAVDEKGAL